MNESPFAAAALLLGHAIQTAAGETMMWRARDSG